MLDKLRDIFAKFYSINSDKLVGIYLIGSSINPVLTGIVKSHDYDIIVIIKDKDNNTEIKQQIAVLKQAVELKLDVAIHTLDSFVQAQLQPTYVYRYLIWFMLDNKPIFGEKLDKKLFMDCFDYHRLAVDSLGMAKSLQQQHYFSPHRTVNKC